MSGTEFAGYAFAGLAGTMAGYPVLNTRFNEVATAAGIAAIATVRNQCSTANLEDFYLQDLESTT